MCDTQIRNNEEFFFFWSYDSDFLTAKIFLLFYLKQLVYHANCYVRVAYFIVRMETDKLSCYYKSHKYPQSDCNL